MNRYQTLICKPLLLTRDKHFWRVEEMIRTKTDNPKYLRVSDSDYLLWLSQRIWHSKEYTSGFSARFTSWVKTLPAAREVENWCSELKPDFFFLRKLTTYILYYYIFSGLSNLPRLTIILYHWLYAQGKFHEGRDRGCFPYRKTITLVSINTWNVWSVQLV